MYEIVNSNTLVRKAKHTTAKYFSKVRIRKNMQRSQSMLYNKSGSIGNLIPVIIRSLSKKLHNKFSKFVLILQENSGKKEARKRQK